MAADIFITFDATGTGMLPVIGETADKWALSYAKNKSAPAPFEIKSFGFNVECKTTLGSGTGGAGVGKATLNEFTIRKNTDRASPAFFQNCATGAHYKSATIFVRKAGGDPTAAGAPYMWFGFAPVFTKGVRWSHDQDAGPEENITFQYGALWVEYHMQGVDGKILSGEGKSAVQVWNQIKNNGTWPIPA